MLSLNHETEFVEREHEILILLSTPNTTDGRELEHWRPVHLSSCLRSLAHWHWCNRRSYADTRSIERLWLSVVQHWHHHQPETKTECKTEWQTHLLLLRVSTGATLKALPQQYWWLQSGSGEWWSKLVPGSGFCLHPQHFLDQSDLRGSIGRWTERKRITIIKYIHYRCLSTVYF